MHSKDSKGHLKPHFHFTLGRNFVGGGLPINLQTGMGSIC